MQAAPLVDKKVQGALLARAARYWVLSVTLVTTLTIVGWLFVSPGIAAMIQLRQQLPSLLGAVLVACMASIVVLPVILLDLARFMNRFVGPVLSLRRSLRQAAAGETVAPMKFRDDDYWQDLASDFNQVMDRLDSTALPGETCQIDQTASAEPLAVGNESCI